jgi:hypothetical protein
MLQRPTSKVVMVLMSDLAAVIPHGAAFGEVFAVPIAPGVNPWKLTSLRDYESQQCRILESDSGDEESGWICLRES